MSLVTRLIGVGLSLLAGWMIGDVQGLQSIVSAVSNIALQILPTVPNTPGVEAGTIAYVFALYAQSDVDPNYASFWEFGVLLAILGFILIVRGDRKPRNPEENAPLLTQPLS